MELKLSCEPIRLGGTLFQSGQESQISTPAPHHTHDTSQQPTISFRIRASLINLMSESPRGNVLPHTTQGGLKTFQSCFEYRRGENPGKVRAVSFKVWPTCQQLQQDLGTCQKKPLVPLPRTTESDTLQVGSRSSGFEVHQGLKTIVLEAQVYLSKGRLCPGVILLTWRVQELQVSMGHF